MIVVPPEGLLSKCAVRTDSKEVDGNTGGEGRSAPGDRPQAARGEGIGPTRCFRLPALSKRPANWMWKDADGNAREEVLFMDCAAFGRTGDAIGEYLTKGRPIHVEGRLKLERWQQDGQNRSKVRVIVEQFRFVDSSRREEQTGGGNGSANGNRRGGNFRSTGKANGKTTPPARGRRPAKTRIVGADNSATFATATATAEAERHETNGDGIPF